jgi:hypothetical protein
LISGELPNSSVSPSGFLRVGRPFPGRLIAPFLPASQLSISAATLTGTVWRHSHPAPQYFRQKPRRASTATVFTLQYVEKERTMVGSWQPEHLTTLILILVNLVMVGIFVGGIYLSARGKRSR